MDNPENKLVNCRRYHCSGNGYTKSSSGVCGWCKAELEKIHYDNMLAAELGGNEELDFDLRVKKQK